MADLSIVGKTVITCFGDSITEGIGACPMDKMSYPARLGELLGDGYSVINMGASGMTLQKEGDYPYYKEPRYEKSFETSPDIVIIMMGTNDSKKWNWNKERYFAELCGIIERFMSIPTHPKLIISSCCTAFSPIDTINNDVISGDMRSVQKKAAEKYGLVFFDMTDKTKDHPEWFCDTLHPNNDGYLKLAEMFANVIKRM